MPDTTNHEKIESETFLALTIDIGTSGIRAALYGESGDEIRGSSVRNAHDLLAGSRENAEIKADFVVEQVARTIDQVVSKNPSSNFQINLIALSCFWHSLVGIDTNWRPVTPVLSWSDTRAARVVEDLKECFDEAEVFSRTGCRFHSSYWPAKLLWIYKRDSRLYREAVHWISLSEYLTYKFFGKFDISISMASATGLLDQRSCKWDEELVKFLGLNHEQLPSIAGDGQSFSGLLPEYSSRWPQLLNAHCYAAIGDGAANNIGTGCVTRARVALMVGTSGAMRVLWKGAAPENVPLGLWRYRADTKRTIVGGALSDGGGLFEWMIASLKIPGTVEEIERAVEMMDPDSHGLTVLPFWSGERSTGWHASARGAVIGLCHSTQPIEILRASMEAVAYRFALIARALDEVAADSLLVASGTAMKSSAVWTQMIADVLGRPLALSATREASSRGAVLLALEMEGKIGDIEDMAISMERTYEPDMERHALYREGLERQEEYYARFIT